MGLRRGIAVAAALLAGSAAPAGAATITTVAGTASATGAYAGDGVPATTASLNAPRGIAATPDGGYLIADEGNAVVRRVDPRGVITRVAGRAQDPQDTSGDGTAARDAHLRQPRGVAPLLGGGFLIADRGGDAQDGGRVRMVSPFGIITTLAGTDADCVGAAPCGDGGPATAATLAAPAAVLALPDGRVLVSDEGAHRVRVISAAGTITTFAGTGDACADPEAACGDGGAATAARLKAPAGLAVAADGAILIADSGDHRVRRVSPSGTITTVAGTGVAGGAGTGGPATAGRLNVPTGVAVAPDGSILVADSFNQVVRRITPGGTLTTLAGTLFDACTPVGPCGDGGDATAARLFTPRDVAVTPDGDVLIADHNTQRVRRVDSDLRLASAPGLRPSGVSVAGARLQDTATGAPLRLGGVSRGALGDACGFGGIQDGPLTAASIVPMVEDWHMTAVRLPINQDCWLGVHGLPKQPGGGTAAEYRDRVVDYVRKLEAAGLAVILDNQFGSVPIPGTASTLSPPLPDATALAFLSSLAQTFRADSGVLFDVYNEPHPDSQEDGFNLQNVPAWTCWRDGCGRRWESPAGPVDYVGVGMQALVDAVRATGAVQPILLGGVRYASDLSGWLAHRPTDPAGALVAAVHFYEFLPGSTSGAEGRPRPPADPGTGALLETPAQAAAARTAAWDGVLAPIAAQVPLVAAEIGEFDCDSDFSTQFFDWADAHDVSYLGWTWNAADGVYWFCDGGTQPGRGGPSLIASYDGTPTPYGAGLRSRLVRLADRVNPSVSIAVPAPGQRLAQGAVVASAFACDDTTAGIRSCTGPATVDTSVPGPRTFTVTAVDRNGNTAMASVDYVVDAPSAPPPAAPPPPPPVAVPPPPPPPAAVPPPTTTTPVVVPPRPLPLLALGRIRSALAVSRTGAVRLPLRCASKAVRCAGIARLTTVVRGRATTIATGRYDVPAGRARTVTLKLTASGRRRVAAARRGRLAVRLALVPTDRAARPATKALTLVAPRPR